MGWTKISEITEDHFSEPQDELEEIIQELILMGRDLEKVSAEYRRGWVYALDHLATELYGRKDE